MILGLCKQEVNTKAELWTSWLSVESCASMHRAVSWEKLTMTTNITNRAWGGEDSTWFTELLHSNIQNVEYSTTKILEGYVKK